MKKITVIIVSILLLSGRLFAATYYIDPDKGNDETGVVNDANHPFKHWSVISWATGNTYLQKRGTVAHEHISTTGDSYACVIIEAGGTSSKPVIIGSYGNSSDPKPIISGDWDVDYGILSTTGSYITIQDIEIRYTKQEGIYIYGGSTPRTAIKINNVLVHHCGKTGILFTSNSSAGTISECEIRNSEMHHCLNGSHCYRFVTDIYFYNCRAYENDMHGFSSGGQSTHENFRINYNNCEAWGQHLNVESWTIGEQYHPGDRVADFARSARYICIASHISSSTTAPNSGDAWRKYWYSYSVWMGDEGNGFHYDDNSSGNLSQGCISHDNQRDGFLSNNASNSSFINCLSYNNGSNGIQFLGLTNYGHVYNCTLVNNNATGCYISRSNPSVIVKNTILMNNKNGLVINNATKPNESYNCFYNNKFNYFDFSLSNAIPIHATDITQDPILNTAAPNTYMQKENSPCINAGTTIVEVTKDIRSITRPQKGNYDIGCYEYTPLCEKPSNVKVILID